ncbi:hypothetical protein C4573_05000 [Candidatus Woesearchaeota archaeon]|nr:MAG: hypothetical protein C4573_05000 [Candidatus Woesearchaeota archaeon]
MTYLIACLSTGKGSWTTVLKLISTNQFEKVFLITNNFGKEKFSAGKNTELLVVDFEKPVKALAKDIKQALEKKIIDTEVALNLSSGTGKEHMAIISALLQSGLGIRFVDFENDFIEV